MLTSKPITLFNGTTLCCTEPCLHSQHMLADSPAELGQNIIRQTAPEPTVAAVLSARYSSQAESSPLAESAASQPRTAQRSQESITPSRAASLEQAPPALYGSPAQTPLGSLPRLAHMLHTPQDMAAARTQGSGPLQSGMGAHDRADASGIDSSPADSCGSGVTASSHAPSSSRQATSGHNPAGHLAWEHTSPTRDEQNPLFSDCSSPDASHPYALSLTSPTETSPWPQHAAELDEGHISVTAEGQNLLSSSPGGSSGTPAGAVAQPGPAQAFQQLQSAAEQPTEHESATTEARNPLLDRHADVSSSAAGEPWEHYSWAMERHETLCDCIDDELRSLEEFAMLSQLPSDGPGGQEDAQVLISQLRHELQASRDEVSKASVPTAQGMNTGCYRRVWCTCVVTC